MNPDIEQQIQQSLGRLRFQTPAQLDEKILADAVREMKRDESRTTIVWWRRAAAILILIGAVAAVILYFNSPTITLAQVNEAMSKQTWTHVKYDNSREQWINLVDGRGFFKDHDGRAVYTEPNGLRLSMSLHTPIIQKDKWFIGDTPPPSNAGKTAWDVFVKSYDDASQPNAPGQQQRLVERHTDTLDGKSLIRFDCYYMDAMNRRILIYQIWADPQTRLPVQVREVLQLAQRKEQNREAIIGRYDFPTTGPATIYDLGVPRDYRIVDSDEKPSPDVAVILDGAKAASERFPKQWRIVKWISSRSGEADVIYRDGTKLASRRWFKSRIDGLPDFPNDPATAEQVLAWSATRLPVSEQISDGQRNFNRRNAIPWISNSPKRASVRVTPTMNVGDDQNYPPGAHWGYRNVRLRVDPPADAPAGIVVLRWEAGDRRRDYWIDPARDYICIRTIEMRLIDGQWKTARVDALENLKQLPGGQWFASQKRFEDYGVGTNLRDRPSVTIEEIDLKVLDPSEIPAGTFDGEQLLKDADLETF